jgi:hypothetical protein
VSIGRRIHQQVIVILLLWLGAAPAAWAVYVDFHWAPSPVVDEGGGLHAPAIEYEVYHRINDSEDELVAVVPDTIFTLEAIIAGRHTIRVRGVDDRGRRGEYSVWSEEILVDPQIQQTNQTIPGSPILYPNKPNPFNPETTISYGVPEGGAGTGRVILEIYDLQGRRVRALPAEESPGTHEVRWDGSDDTGRTMPTGQYVVRYQCGDQTRTWKMTMVK